MSLIFRLKQRLRTGIAHVWPFGVLTVIGILVLDPPTDGKIHTSRFAEAVFGFVRGKTHPEWHHAATGVLTAIAWVLILLVLVRIATGVLASNSRLFKRLARRLEARDGVTSVELTPNGTSAVHRLSRSFASDSPRQTVLSYSVQAPQGETVRIEYQDTFAREGWRLRIGQTTRATVQSPVDLPTVHILSKATTASQSSLVERLRNPGQYVELEGDFSEIFSVYVARGYETYALEVLQPVVMEKLRRVARGVDIELADSTIVISQPHYAVTPEELVQFESVVLECLTIVRPYLTKQVRLGESREYLPHQYEYFDPEIRPMRLFSDVLLKVLAGCFAIAVALIAVSEILPIFPDQTKSVASGFRVTYANPWKDALEALSLLIFVFAFFAFAAAEVELLIRRLVFHQRRRTAQATVKSTTR
ncbi:hypothetical protein I0C86_40145 [Plantactinospora sp. S1510]|uniref:Uncharacterized protein n=1 Tax=Plantactinospora alkalitolerans TaxID=2789879 RepID=A0ABS0HA03_9ACTN|nr:hypothetical protein [Plantactinospora alkalitolerans]MBF9135091.1 hypothetical protein [Plantactinospora alkalitolerans]